MARAKHIPLRSCAACGQRLAKGQLTRIVRGIDGKVQVDPTGKRAGRGTYLCGSQECWTSGLGRGRIGHSLRSSITEEDQAGLIEYFRQQNKAAGIGDVR